MRAREALGIIAFVCTAMREKLKQPEITLAEDAWTTISRVGFDPGLGHSYYFVVQMYPFEETQEFAFPFVTVDNRTGSVEHTYDSREVALVVDSACRAHMAEMLMQGTKVLLHTARPDAFVMITYLKHIPDHAMRKYERLCDLFRSLGYFVSQVPRTDGKYEWRMSR